MNRYGLILIASILLLPGCISSEDAPQPNLLEQLSTSTPLSRERLRQVATAITVQVHANDNSGSGVLIRKDGQQYTVITNDHVLIPGKPYSIVTPDGKTHAATLMAKYNNRSDGGYNLDLALLQFEAADDYEVASIANSPLVGEQPVFASGFPYDADGLQFTEGKIPSWAMSLGKQALQDGYQIGYSNEIRQGMSGGPILNGSGELIGINGLSAYPILQTAYVFENGESPTDALLADLNRVSWGIPIGRLLEVEPSFGETAPYATFDPASLTGVAAKVNKIAQEITVRIDQSRGNGSGIIIAQRGNSYYVLTAQHVVKNEEKYQVVTHDGKRYPVDYSTVQTLGVDLAVLQFQSQESYPLATLANYDQGNYDWVFLSGWPGLKLGESRRPYPLFTAGFVFSKEWGAIRAKDSSSLTETNGYELVYTNPTLGGMSGGPVLDSRGRVIGIHAAAEGEEVSNVQLGFSLGVPVRTFLSLASRAQISSQWLRVEESVPLPLNRAEKTAIREALFAAKKPPKGAKANDWVNYGNQLWRLFEYEDAVAAFDEAIKLNPYFEEAWYARGLALIVQRENQASLASFDKATEINPSFYQAWRQRGEALYFLKQYPEALASVDKAIAIEPKDSILYFLQGEILIQLELYAEAVEAYSQVIKIKPYPFAYFQRGYARGKLGDYKGAIADYSQALKIIPDDAKAYGNRGISRHKLGDYKGAIADYNRAIKINPNDANAYYSRGVARDELRDHKGAIADYNIAIKINPDDAETYYKRGNASYKLGEYQEAIADFNRAIKIKPDYAEVYVNRGTARRELGDKQGAIADFSKAIEINSDPLAYAKRGLLYEELGDKQKAIEDMQKAVQISCAQGSSECQAFQKILRYFQQ
ncbi:MAG: tetratricopeptide repeat protein [Hormoscilla sp. GUM202]|nr:tetratricopeptide repeat protein [Hormoscilla sp. GUM202]